MEDSKNKIEAVLFSSGKKMSVEELSKLTRTPVDTVAASLKQLKSDYDSKDSSLFLSDEGDGWKMTTREQYSNVVRKIVAETELTRSLMETLAVIAWKAPVLQSDIIKVRTNKAYDHLSELENTGFISRNKHGRTKLIKLTDKFFNYFDLKNADEIKAKFKIEPPAQKTLAEATVNVPQESGEPAAEESSEATANAEKTESASEPEPEAAESTLPEDGAQSEEPDKNVPP